MILLLFGKWNRKLDKFIIVVLHNTEKGRRIRRRKSWEANRRIDLDRS